MVRFGGRLLSVATVAAMLLPGSAITATATAAALPHAKVGDTKTQCAYASNSIARLQALSTSIGRAIDCSVLFSDNTTDWNTWEQPWFIRTNAADNQWAGWVAAKAGRRIVLTQSMVPWNIGSDWRAQAASGAFDDHVRAWAANMVNAGFGAATIRLGHEANGDWYFDGIGNSADDYANWAAYWARFVRVARAIPGADFTFDWTVNAGYRRIPFASYYPGDDVVDIVGIDQYDGMAIAPHPVPTTPAGRWTALVAQQWGLGDLMAFASSHGKPLSIPEWGLMQAGSANGTGGGDDPTFVNGIADVVRDHVVSYESVWDTDSPTSPLVNAIEDEPASLAAYRDRFGSRGDASPNTGSPAATPTPGAGAPSGTAAPAPAVGASAPGAVKTYVVARPASRSVKAGAKFTVTGLLVGDGHALIGQTLLLQRLVNKHWSVVARGVTNAHGLARLSHKPSKTTLYRLRFAGGGARAASASLVVTVKVVKAKPRHSTH